MIKLDLNNIEDLAKIGVLLANDIFPTQGTNYINEDGTKEQYAYFTDEATKHLNNYEDKPEYKAAYLMAVFIIEARKQVPLMVHKLPNEKEIIIPVNTDKNRMKEILNLVQ